MVTTTTSARACAPTGLVHADLDGDGCDETFAFANGVLTAGSQRWHVGVAGDLAAVARWGCSRRAALALVRPATGQVWVFEGWAREGQPVTGRLVGSVPGAADVSAADPDHDGCAEVVVARRAGSAAVLEGAGS
jgi:hypothetical protein